jgi:putative sterol carrier protein
MFGPMGDQQAPGVGAPTRLSKAPAPGLAGLRGRLRLQVGDQTAGALVVDDGQVELTDAKSGGPREEAVALFSDVEDMKKLLRGEVNPVVAALQGRMALRGDLVFATKVILGLRVSSPFAGAVKKGG